MLLASTSIGQSLSSFFAAVGQFFADLEAVHWGTLALGLLFFGLNLTLRSRAFFNSLRAAYPASVIKWRRIWGAYFAAVGFNNVVPARGGDMIKLFLARSSIPGSSYPTVAAAFFVEAVFDVTVGVFVLIFAFTRGVFPKPPDFSKLNSFDISYLAAHFRFTLFLITALAILALVAFAVLSVRARAFWVRVRQGMTILSDRPRYLREVASLQALGWLCRAAAFWFMLDAFRVGGSVTNVLLVFGVNQVAGAVPFTPGGAGVQQALLVKVFATSAPTAVVAAYSVGQQLAIAVVHGADRPRRGGLHLPLPLVRGSAPRRSCLTRRRAGGGARRGAAGRGPSVRRSSAGPAPPSQPADALLKPLARLAHEGDGLGEHAGHHRADLLCLGLGVALQVDPLDGGDRHVDRQLDRVIRPGKFLVALHLFGEFGQAPLQLLGIAEQISKAAALHTVILAAPKLVRRLPCRCRAKARSPSSSPARPIGAVASACRRSPAGSSTS